MFSLVSLLSFVTFCSCLVPEYLDKEYSKDTSKCVEATKQKYPGDPNAGLDHFVTCLLQQLKQVSNTIFI